MFKKTPVFSLLWVCHFFEFATFLSSPLKNISADAFSTYFSISKMLLLLPGRNFWTGSSLSLTDEDQSNYSSLLLTVLSLFHAIKLRRLEVVQSREWKHHNLLNLKESSHSQKHSSWKAKFFEKYFSLSNIA